MRPAPHEHGFLMAEALVALAIAALMAALVFDTVWQMGRTSTAAGEQRQALLLARSILSAASVPGPGTPIAARGADGRLAWAITREPFAGDAADSLPLETVRVVVSEGATGRVLVRLASLKARE